MVLEIYDREAMGEVTAKEIAIITRQLIEEYGDGGAMTPAEIARILIDEDLPVKFEQIFRMAAPNEKYEILLEGLTLNQSLAAAETSLEKISQFHQQFSLAGDKTGIRYVRQTALRAKENAIALSSSSRSSSIKSKEQSEIARWFTIWLQTPNIFWQWLELRKSTAEFKRDFGEHSLKNESDSGK